MQDPIMNILTPGVESKAAELRSIASRVKNMTTAERQYDDLIKDATEQAKLGKMSICMRKMKENFFTEHADPSEVPAGSTAAEFAHQVYVDQSTVLDMLRSNGFTVTEEEPEMPNQFSLDPNEIAMAHRAMSLYKYIEKEVTISWE